MLFRSGPARCRSKLEYHPALQAELVSPAKQSTAALLSSAVRCPHLSEEPASGCPLSRVRQACRPLLPGLPPGRVTLEKREWSGLWTQNPRALMGHLGAGQGARPLPRARSVYSRCSCWRSGALTSRHVGSRAAAGGAPSLGFPHNFKPEAGGVGGCPLSQHAWIQIPAPPWAV